MLYLRSSRGRAGVPSPALVRVLGVPGNEMFHKQANNLRRFDTEHEHQFQGTLDVVLADKRKTG